MPQARTSRLRKPLLIAAVAVLLAAAGWFVLLRPTRILVVNATLAAGDLASMAYNMQVAFATTVVGLLIAAIGVVTLQVRQRWCARELNDLEFIAQTLRHEKES